MRPAGVNRRMEPARCVSPEVAAMLPPVGLIQGPPVAPPVLQPQRPAIEAAGGAAAWSRSTLWTVAVLLTAMGAGAIAIVPILPRDNARVPSGRSAAEEPEDEDREAAPAPVARLSADLAADPGAIEVKPIAPAPFAPAMEADLDGAAAEIMRFLRGRDIAAASRLIERLLDRSWPEAQVAHVERYAALVEAVRGFWQNFGRALDGARAGHSVTWNGREAVIVDVDDSQVILHTAGGNRRLTRDTLSDTAVRYLAEGLLDMKDPRNQVQLGAFLFVADGGNAPQARRLWESAAAAGEDVARLSELLAD